MPSAKLVYYPKEYMEILKLAVSKPYGSNPTVKTIQAVINSGHTSVLEHVQVTFDVTCSVRVLGQLTRHRHHSFTVKSSRGSEFDNLVVPKKLADFWISKGYDVEQKKQQAFALYKEARENDVPLEDAAYVLPQGVETTLTLSGNLRCWFNYLPLRLCRRALHEHRELAGHIYQALIQAMPEIFDRNFLNCANCKEKSCDFK